MATIQTERGRKDAVGNDTASGTSSIPLLGDGFSAPARTSQSSKSSTKEESELDSTTKSGKRRFWNLGKKKEEERSKAKGQPGLVSPTSAPAGSNTTMVPSSPLHSPVGTHASTSPNRLPNPLSSPSSPGGHVYSPSSRPLSTASSQIFERNVQEDVAVSAQLSPAIPAHIITENHIPAVLEASSVAITNDKLDPDSVEIVTHGSHQPAAVAVTGASGLTDHSLSSSFYDEPPSGGHAHLGDGEETASNYGTLDSGDVRRLSFISFADVVHAENGELSPHLNSHTAATAAHNRSPSPIRSPVSSHGFSTSPPTSVSPSFKGLEVSPTRANRTLGSPNAMPAASPPLSGELQIETMRQALRKTGSGDLSGARSQPLSAVGTDDGNYAGDRPFK